MKKVHKGTIYAIPLALLFIMVCSFHAETNAAEKNQDKQMRQAAGVWDLQFNTAGNFSFPVTNYGIDFVDMQTLTGAGIWPRGSENQYIFAGGVWFAAKKWRTISKSGYPDTTYLWKYVSVTYDPNSGTSWMTPGRIEDGDTLVEDLSDKYRIYFSTDFNPYTGEPLDSEDGPNWPLWLEIDGTEKYVHDIEQRNTENYPAGPVFKSDEDIYCVFKDTDMDQYASSSYYEDVGYPLNLQFEKMIYSWSYGTENDIVLFSYNIINMSQDTLFDCYFSPIYDIDIALSSNSSSGAKNDRTDFYNFLYGDDTLDLAYMFTNTDRGEEGKGFGYIGIAYLNTPAEDGNNFIRTDKESYDYSEQLGTSTFRNWPVEVAPKGDAERYDFMSAGVIDGDDGSGDKRFLMSTGPFHVRPGEAFNITYAIIFASPVDDEADNTSANLANLVDKVKFARNFYKNGFEPRKVEDGNDVYDNSFVINPNPATDRINITYNSGNASKVLVELTDVLGNSYYTGTEYLNSGKNDFLIDTRELQSGVYYITINDGENSVTRLLNIVK